MIENRWVYQTRFYKGVLLLVILFVLLFSATTLRRLPAVQAESAAQARNRKIFLPAISNIQATRTDLVIQRVEVTQAVQDSNNSVPLIAGRSTMLRIYAVNNGESKSIPGVKVAIVGRAEEALFEGAEQQMTATINGAANAAVFTSTINYRLPDHWASGTYEIMVSVDSDNVVPETNENNNTQVIRLRFNAVPPLRIIVVPVTYTSTEDGITYPAPNQDIISDTIRRMYPVGSVQVVWHAPYAFTGNMKELGGFTTLLSQINGLKSAERAPATNVYYALVPTRLGASSWFRGGLVGMGYIGGRVSVGLDYSNAGATAAHEIGHNLGRYHAPCGNPSGPDSSYPYPTGAIGQYGLDVVSGTLYGPNETKDLMSYCTPKWISDYTYRGIYNALFQTGADMAAAVEAERVAQPVLWVRGHAGSGGTSLLPVYTVEGAPTPVQEDSPYRVQLIGAGGAVLSDLPYAALEIATESDETLFEIQAQVPLPAEPVAAVRLVREGQVLAEQPIAGAQTMQAALAGADLQAVQVEAVPGGLRLSWEATGPAMVRYSSDGGATWSLLAADVLNGSLVVDASFEGSQFQVTAAQ